MDAEREEEIECVALSMRETLIEVLGEEAGSAMYSLEWLRARVHAHLDPAQLDGAGFIAEAADGSRLGHLLARPDRDGERSIGLIATVYVDRLRRGAGIASRLFESGEAWLHARGFDEIAYDT
ncbi:MAG: GNAT family N-acetyltransferase, partial [Planctomycetota bacterium]|nr:GNAT family N-acetyltransferase [Planctomycetota bacterium]